MTLYALTSAGCHISILFYSIYFDTFFSVHTRNVIEKVIHCFVIYNLHSIEKYNYPSTVSKSQSTYQKLLHANLETSAVKPGDGLVDSGLGSCLISKLVGGDAVMDRV